MKMENAVTQDEIIRLRKLIETFHAKEVRITDEQLCTVYDFLYLGAFYPMKEKMAVRDSVIDTILYLKHMATRSGYDTLDKIESYFKKRHEELDKMFQDHISKS